MRKSRVIGIIPARLDSKRLAGKPLIKIHGKPLIQCVYESAAKSRSLDRLMVVTDSSRISDLVFAFGGEAYVSLRNHPTGSDRVAEVARNLNCNLVINIQCDLPHFPPTLIDVLVSSMLREKGTWMGTLATRINDPARLKNPNVVKVVLDKNGFALYFSRYPIPFIRQADTSSRGAAPARMDVRRLTFYEHIGMYGFRKDFLMRFSSLTQTPLEKSERLEQLRALENGYRIRVYLTGYKPVTVDVPSDLKKVRAQKGGAVR
ncbi:MAG: 3-deoxy-manno-octulosonate cytidylyltransferase [candidate division Zixibacteria bacterium]|nr:3-deoxy-manno-octulosonate cytidylyltransferase [candidate division Zixibacteria bacterium]